MLTHNSWYSIKSSHLLISPPISSEKSSSTGKLSNSQWHVQLFQNSSFYLKAQILSLTNTVSCFQLLEVAVSVHFLKKMSAKYPSVNNYSLLVILSSKKWCFVKKVTSSVRSSSTRSFPWDNLYPSMCSTRAEGVILTSSHRILKRRVLSSWD